VCLPGTFDRGQIVATTHLSKQDGPSRFAIDSAERGLVLC